MMNFQQSNLNKAASRRLALLCIAVNALAFLMVIAMYPPAWYTNDDYRMMTIVSGAYTGTPNADIVFMRYPVGLMLSGLYSLTTQIPWYGLFTMVCMFVPSCIFCYYIIKKAYLKNITAVGAALYAVLFLFFIQKYIRLPQFTLTSAFMATGAIVLFHEMPARHNAKQIILAALCCLGSFSVRSKTFYMLLPVIILVIVVRLIREKGTKLWKPYLATCLSAVIFCTGVAIADYASWNRNEDYRYFDRFNVARSQVYDYGGAPNYFDNMPFYLENDINEVTYRAISARYLDIDSSVDAETLEKVGDYIDEVRRTSDTVWGRIKTAVEETIEYWIDSGDDIVKYGAICVFILLGITLVLCAKNKKLNLIFPASVAGLVLENVLLEFAARRVVRVVDAMLLSLGVLGCLAVMDALNKRTKTFKECYDKLRQSKSSLVAAGLVAVSVVAVAFAGVSGLNTALKDKYHVVTVTQNSRMDALKTYAARYPDNFFFYDANDFISCTEYVFKTYDEGTILNHDSMGSWNVHAPSYFERNNAFGFSTSANGLTAEKGNVYFVATGTLRMGITKTLKDVYNKTLRLVETVDSDNFVLYVYMVTDDD